MDTLELSAEREMQNAGHVTRKDTLLRNTVCLGGVHNITELHSQSADEEDFAFLSEVDCMWEEKRSDIVYLNQG